MPWIKGDEGAVVIQPQGDIFFCNATDEDGVMEFVIADPGINKGVGALAPELCGKSTADVNALVRVKMTPATCAVMLEQLAIIQTLLLGMPSRQVA